MPTCGQISPTALYVNELGQLFLIKAAVSPGVLEVKGYSFMTFSCVSKLVLLSLCCPVL